MTAANAESRIQYDLPATHPWSEHRAFDWLLEAVAVLTVAAGALVVLA